MNDEPEPSPEFSLLRDLLRRNEYGAWFVRIDEQTLAPLTKWLWHRCETVMQGREKTV